MTFIKSFSVFLLVLFCSTEAWSERSLSGVSFPYSLSLDSANYSDALWLVNGGTHTWRDGASYCWSGGCAEFTPPTTQGGLASLGQFTEISGHGFTRYSVRWLEYWGSTYLENTINCKVLITETTTAARPSVFDMREPDDAPYLFVSLAATDGTLANYPDCDPPYGVCESTQLQIGDRSNGRREGEWISFELLVDLRDSGDPSAKLYVTTQDGTFNEQLISDADITPSTGVFEYIDFLGTYCDRGVEGGLASTPDGNNFYRIDEVVINGTTDGSSPYISPPAGFLESTQPSITGIPTIIGVSIQ